MVEYPVARVHKQNGLAESLIKRLQLIARPLLMKSKFPSSAWAHAILHVAALIRLRPSASHKYSLLQLVSRIEPSLSHLKVFGCGVYVPISTPQQTKMRPKKRLGIYVAFNSPSIIKYLEPLTRDVFTAHFADCQFDETMFLILGGENKKLDKILANIKRLQRRLMDVVTAYLYGSLDSDIYMKIPEGLKMPEACKSKPHEMFLIKMKRSLYGLKQSGRMWYNLLSKYLSKEGYKTRVESFKNEGLGEEHAFKRGRKADIVASKDIYLVNVHNDEDIFGVNDLDGDEVKDKGKGKMAESKPMKKLSMKDQLMLDDELVFKLQAEEEEERLAREKA
nr:retrovirus-related Pol polyprotein from transposon TNT 1-94 [Tanacetum cinerariifolium]